MSMNTNITLRQAGAADWGAVQALLDAHQLPTAGAREHLSTYVLAVSNGEVAGCAGAEVYGDIALLRSMAVALGLQGRGIGRSLLTALIQEAVRRQMRALYLLTMTAPEYFARYGFERLAREQAPAALQASAELQGACPASAVFMALPLTATAPKVRPQALPVAVIGAGPVGLAAAARLIERGIEPVLLEAGARVGANLLDYGHVRLFSPWRYNVDASMAAQLAATGWSAPPEDEVPLAREVVEKVLQPYAELPALARALRLNTRVTAISREGFDKLKSAGREAAPFLIRALQDGQPVEIRARAVIDASGTWTQPNPLGASGLPALGERENADAIYYGIPDVLGRDRERYAGRRTLVVGAGHSAANALLALAELSEAVPGTRLAWAVRSPVLARVFGGGEADALPARGALGASLKALHDSGRMEFVSGLRIAALRREDGSLTVEGTGPDGRPLVLQGIDEIVCATGQRPDPAMGGELRLKLDPWLESSEVLGPLIDPNLHSCGTVRPHGHRELAHPESGFYTLGVKSYGRAPTFLMATGFEQARSVVAAIAGDLEAADRVELDLPETGVCSVSTALGGRAEGNSGFCGGPAKSDPAACCALDEHKKAQGESGCGCGAPEPAAAAGASCGSGCGRPAAKPQATAGCCG